MKVDLTEFLKAFDGSKGEPWTSRRAELHARRMAKSINGQVDWDGGAGERWISILVRGEEVAVVCTWLPWWICQEAWSSRLPAVVGLERVIADDFISRVFTCDEDVLTRCIGEHSVEIIHRNAGKPVNRNAFSVRDLWYATV